MSSPSPVPSNKQFIKANTGSTDSSPSDMSSPEDSPPDSSLMAERINLYMEDESTMSTDMLSVETEDDIKAAPNMERIESELNAFDDAFGDDRNGTVEHEGDGMEEEEESANVRGEKEDDAKEDDAKEDDAKEDDAKGDDAMEDESE